MRLINWADVPTKEFDEQRAAEVKAFYESGGELCIVETFRDDVNKERNRYNQVIWRMGLTGIVKPFTRRGKLLLKRLDLK